MFETIVISTAAPFLTFPITLFKNEEIIQEQQIHQHTTQEIIVHNGYDSSSPVQNYVNYAYNIGGIDFVKLIECENGTWDPKSVSTTQDHGLCQLNYAYNKKFINSADFSDPYKQLDYCYEKFKINPKLWYGPDRKIKGKKCTDYVSDRFDIILV